jgi:hypothetical protein
MNRLLLFLSLLALGGVLAAPGGASAATFEEGMQPILREYLSIQDALASDTLAGVPEAARKLGAAARALDVKKAGRPAAELAALTKELATSASTLGAAKDLAAARQAFKTLSRPMVAWATVARPAGIEVMSCSMVEGKWLQKTRSVRNPYYGASMLKCGERVSAQLQAPGHGGSGKPHALAFTDVKAQTREFIGYHQSIKLTPEQQKVKAAVLGAIPAPCCANFSALTCCCPCNFSKALWGMTHYLIAREGYDQARLKDAVDRWIAFSRPNGSSGKACFTPGGCNRSFAHDGCGGMTEDQLVL